MREMLVHPQEWNRVERATACRAGWLVAGAGGPRVLLESSKALRGNSEGWRENEWSLLGGMGHRDIGRGSHIFAWACQDPVTRSRQILPLYCSLMSEGTFGAHPPHKEQ